MEGLNNVADTDNIDSQNTLSLTDEYKLGKIFLALASASQASLYYNASPLIQNAAFFFWSLTAAAFAIDAAKPIKISAIIKYVVTLVLLVAWFACIVIFGKQEFVDIEVGNDISLKTSHGHPEEVWIRAKVYNYGVKIARCKMRILELQKEGDASIMGKDSPTQPLQAIDGGDGDRFDFLQVYPRSAGFFDIASISEGDPKAEKLPDHLYIASYPHWKDLYPKLLGVGHYELKIGTVGENCISSPKTLSIDYLGGLDFKVRSKS